MAVYIAIPPAWLLLYIALLRKRLIQEVGQLLLASYRTIETEDVFPVQFGVILHMPSHPTNPLCFLPRYVASYS